MNALKTNLRLLRRFWPYLLQQRRVLLADLFCAALTTACEIALPLFVRKITNAAVSDIASLTLRTILLTGCAYFLLRCVDGAASYYKAAQGHFMGAKIETEMRNDLFAHLQGLSFSYYDNTRIGQLMSRLTNDLFDVTEFAHHFPEELCVTSIKILACLVIFAQMNRVMAAVVFTIVPLMFLVTRYSRRRMKRAFLDSRRQVGEINSLAEDSLLGIRVVKSFGSEGEESGKFRRSNARFFGFKRRGYAYMAQYQTLSRMFDGFLYLAAVCFGAWLLRKGQMRVGDFSLTLLMVSTLLDSVRRIIEFSEQFNRGITGIERFAEIMDELTETQCAQGDRELTQVRGEITFDRVSFVYPGTDRYVLRDFSLRIAPGESVALVGPSGGGKTTLCNLVPRFYDVTQGSLRIDGQDVRSLTLASLRRNIGVVQQDIYLFSGSVRENIAYGAGQATEEEIREAARLAYAEEFIEKLPQGYDTYVGERGVKLSGGQKQRISIARVFLKNPPILLLDEATSALDNESERLVQASLERLAQGRTTITVAHRLTTIRHAEQIVVLTEDGAAECGTHEALLDANGIYSTMWNR
ncbi:MAG: ABC transporter ATP-binding protein/permease [Oscillospiraceae bacterium]|jgi:ATP-binding cassette subfamily B protein|nr:ABC transporter ATP-binding protein/permease [Oscillospiraceae bacterium]